MFLYIVKSWLQNIEEMGKILSPKTYRYFCFSWQEVFPEVEIFPAFYILKPRPLEERFVKPDIQRLFYGYTDHKSLGLLQKVSEILKSTCGIIKSSGHLKKKSIFTINRKDKGCMCHIWGFLFLSHFPHSY